MIKKITIVAVCIVGILLMTNSLFVMADTRYVEPDISGIWSSNSIPYTLELEQRGSSVVGKYSLADGHVTGTLTGNKLSGTWIENEDGTFTGEKGRNGHFVFIFSEDFKTIKGTWGYGSAESGGGTWDFYRPNGKGNDDVKVDNDKKKEDLPILLTFKPEKLPRGGIYSFIATGLNFKSGDYIYIKGNDGGTVAKSKVNDVSKDGTTFNGEIEVVSWMPLGSCETLYYRPSIDYWDDGPTIDIVSEGSPYDDLIHGGSTPNKDDTQYPEIETFSPSSLPRGGTHRFTVTGKNFKSGDLIYIKGNDGITSAKSNKNVINNDGTTFTGEIEVVSWMPLGSCETLYYRPSNDEWFIGPVITIY